MLLRCWLIVVACLSGADALACSTWGEPPEVRFARSQAVVLAVPKTVTFQPKAASDVAYTGPFRQTIVWEVLIRWKGGHQRGGTLTTQQSFSGIYGCGTDFPIRSRDVRILYLTGKEPYEEFIASTASNGAWDFRYLESLRGR